MNIITRSFLFASSHLMLNNISRNLLLFCNIHLGSNMKSFNSNHSFVIDRGLMDRGQIDKGLIDRGPIHRRLGRGLDNHSSFVTNRGLGSRISGSRSRIMVRLDSSLYSMLDMNVNSTIVVSSCNNSIICASFCTKSSSTSSTTTTNSITSSADSASNSSGKIWNPPNWIFLGGQLERPIPNIGDKPDIRYFLKYLNAQPNKLSFNNSDSPNWMKLIVWIPGFFSVIMILPNNEADEKKQKKTVK